MSKINIRLFEKIKNYEIDEKFMKSSISENIINSISKYLVLILNTRQGSAPIDPNFGVPDFTNHIGGLSSGNISNIEEEITRMVQNYEPRLSNPKVRLLQEQSDILSLKFSLAGEVCINEQEIPFRLLTTVGSSGKISLQQ